MLYQFSRELPWKQKIEPCFCLLYMNLRSFTGSCEIRMYWSKRSGVGNSTCSPERSYLIVERFVARM